MLLGVEWNRKTILKFKMAVKCADAMIITLFFYYFSFQKRLKRPLKNPVGPACPGWAPTVIID